MSDVALDIMRMQARDRELDELQRLRDLRLRALELAVQRSEDSAGIVDLADQMFRWLKGEP